MKIFSFLKSVRGSSIVRPGTSTTCSDTLQSERDETDFNSAAQKQLESVEQSALEKTDMYVCDKECTHSSYSEKRRVGEKYIPIMVIPPPPPPTLLCSLSPFP
ncbi:unnamed protein product [Diatraea saccharalis]|uniref:Uncharacterized protein n=1 Tax=Diatraea saccharalis TaxID=40085 RepID=A0A9N9RB11_9NEOP|nr:unnamed protein product [Diatraea saccharalis]